MTILKQISQAAVVGLFVVPLLIEPAASRSLAMNKCIAGGKSEAQCACIGALEIGTKTALQKFVKQYGRTKTVCNSRATTLLIKIPAKAIAPTSNVTVKVKNNKGLGNSDEGDCSGNGCSDPDNPGNGGTSGGGGGGSSGGGGGGNGGGNGGGKK